MLGFHSCLSLGLEGGGCSLVGARRLLIAVVSLVGALRLLIAVVSLVGERGLRERGRQEM